MCFIQFARWQWYGCSKWESLCTNFDNCRHTYIRDDRRATHLDVTTVYITTAVLLLLDKYNIAIVLSVCLTHAMLCITFANARACCNCLNGKGGGYYAS